MRCDGLTKREVRARLAGPNVLLNLAYSLHPPFLLEFERRIFCDLDPSEIFLGCREVWMADSRRVAQTPPKYRRYLASATAEFTAIKGVDVSWRTGWVSERAAAFLALGRPVITEDTGAAAYLPEESGFCFVHSAAEAAEAARRVLRDWPRLSREARECAVEVFDSAKNLRKILALQAAKGSPQQRLR